MAKGGSRFSSGSNGGIMGSGIFGVFGTTIKCDSKDDSMYCNIMKLFNILIVFFVVCFIIYFVYTYILKPYFLKKK
jgi:hypothetical protein